MIIYPDRLIDSIQEITIHFIKENKLKALILDVDNTLIDYDKKLSQDIIDWAKMLKGQGVKLYILSNTNKKQKVENVAKKLDIPFKMFARKPSKRGFRNIQEELNIPPENIGVVGDQIFTDVIGGNRSNMFTILVEPIDKRDLIITAWKRPIERKIKNRFKEKEKNKKAQ